MGLSITDVRVGISRIIFPNEFENYIQIGGKSQFQDNFHNPISISGPSIVELSPITGLYKESEFHKEKRKTFSFFVIFSIQ